MKIEDYSRYYIQGSDHYLVPKDVFIELFDEMESLRQECKEYKERITKAVKIINNDRMYDDNDFEGRVFQHDLLKVLENEEIIGVKDEKVNC